MIRAGIHAVYWSPTWAATIGVVWIVAHIIYFIGYLADPAKRFWGVFIQSVATFALLLGALGKIMYLWAL